MLQSTSPARISADVISNLFVLNDINVIWVLVFQWIPEQSKGKSYMDSVFLSQDPSIKEKWEEIATIGKTLLFQLFYYDSLSPWTFCLPLSYSFSCLVFSSQTANLQAPLFNSAFLQTFFTACFVTLLSFLHSFLGHGAVDSWQVIVINHVQESNLLCLSEENIQWDSSFPGKFYCLIFGVFSVSFDRTGYLTICLCFFIWQSKNQALLLYLQSLYNYLDLFFPLLAGWISCNCFWLGCINQSVSHFFSICIHLYSHTWWKMIINNGHATSKFTILGL